MPTGDVSVVLVHGAWADGSSWARVITALKADAVNVLAAPLPLSSPTTWLRSTAAWIARKAKIKAHLVGHTPSVTASRAVVDIIREAIRGPLA